MQRISSCKSISDVITYAADDIVQYALSSEAHDFVTMLPKDLYGKYDRCMRLQ